MKRYIIIGAMFGLVAPFVLMVEQRMFGHSDEFMAMAILIPGFLPFGSDDPDQTMSWIETVAAFGLNSLVFALVGLLIGVLRKRAAQPNAPADGLRPPLS